MRFRPLFAPMWVTSTVAAPLGILSRPPVARMRTGSTLFATLSATQPPNFPLASQRVAR